jgi:hypothetical protein
MACGSQGEGLDADTVQGVDELLTDLGADVADEGTNDATGCLSDDDCTNHGLVRCTEDALGFQECIEVETECFQWSQVALCNAGEVCLNGTCALPCTGSCDGRVCGDDGCGGSCGACFDNDPCTNDTCSQSGQCVFGANTATCDDGEPCTANDTCNGGLCVGLDVDCNDGNACTSELCQPGLGCSFTSLEGGCSDDDACTTGDVCADGVCASGETVDCDDSDDCTNDSCTPESGCLNELNDPLCEIPEESCWDEFDNDSDNNTDCADTDCFESCCDDGILNGDETAIDCGGNCGACLEDSCAEDSDCAVGSCVGMVCEAPEAFYWVGGGGAWSDYENHWATSSGSTTFHDRVPAATDDIYFDQNSFGPGAATVDIDVIHAECRDMDWTGVTSPITVTGEPDKALHITGSFRLAPTITWAASTKLIFEGGNYHVIHSRGASIAAGEIRLNNPDGHWALGHALATISGYFYVDSGSFDTAGKDMHVRRFYATGSQERSIDLKDSHVTIVQFWFMEDTTNLTFDAGTSTIHWNANNTYRFAANDVAFHDLDMSVNSGVATIQGNFSFHGIEKGGEGALKIQDSLTIGASLEVLDGQVHFSSDNTIEVLAISAGVVLRLGSGATQTIGAITGTGTCTENIYIVATQSGSPAFLSQSTGQVSLDFAHIKDVHAIGGASFAAANSFDDGGNTGWQIQEKAPQAYFWIGGSGNWSDSQHWSINSGGAPADCVRGSSDDVVFDENSFTEEGKTVTLDVPLASCKSMTWQNTIAGASVSGGVENTLSIHGSLTLSEDMSWNSNGDLNFFGPGAKTLDLKGVSFSPYNIYLDDSDAVWSMLSDITGNSTYLNLIRGGFDTGGHDLLVRRFISNNSNPRSINLGDSDITIIQFWFMSTTTNLEFDAGSSTIHWNASNTYSFEATDLSFHDLDMSINSGAVTLRGDMSFNHIIKEGQGDLSVEDALNVTTFDLNAGRTVFNEDTSAETLTLSPGVFLEVQGGKTLSTQNLNGSGTCSNYIHVKSKTSGVPATISQPSGEVALNFAHITDTIVSGGATFVANQSFDHGGNVGWGFSPITPQDYYWVGGGGNWTDGSHWSLESGGAGSGCGPTYLDNVFFDANSFTGPNQTVTVDAVSAECNNMIWTGVTHTPGVLGDSGISLTVHGDFVLDASMSWNSQADIFFKSPGTHIIDPKGVSMGSYNIYLDATDGSWSLASDLVINSGYFHVVTGNFDSGGHTMNIRRFYSNNPNLRSISLQDSTIELKQFWFMANTSNLTFDAGTSIINWNASNTYGFESNNVSFHKLQVSIGSGTTSIKGTLSFQEIVKNGDGILRVQDTIDVTEVLHLNAGTLELDDSNTFNELNLTSGTVLELGADKTQTVHTLSGAFNGVTTFIQPESPGVTAYWDQGDAPVCFDYFNIAGVHFTGSGSVHADHSVDSGGNLGIVFGPCP